MRAKLTNGPLDAQTSIVDRKHPESYGGHQLGDLQHSASLLIIFKY